MGGDRRLERGGVCEGGGGDGERAGAAIANAVASAADNGGSAACGGGVGYAPSVGGGRAARGRRRCRLVRPGGRLPQPRVRRWVSLRGAKPRWSPVPITRWSIYVGLLWKDRAKWLRPSLPPRFPSSVEGLQEEFASSRMA